MNKLLITTVLAAASVACSAQANTSLRMSWWGGESRHTATQAALKVCGAKHNIDVTPEFTGFDGYLEKLTTQMAGGTEADIVQVNWPWLPLFSKTGDGFYDMSQLKSIDLTQWPDAALDTTKINGKINGVPVSITGRSFFFNVTSFEKAGIPVPTTWDELFASVEPLKKALGKEAHPFNAVKETAQLLVTLEVVQATGKDLVDPETHTVAWTPEELAKGIEFYGKLVKTGAVQSIKQEAGEGNVNLYEKPAWAKGQIGGSYEWDSTFFKYSDPLAEGQKLEPRPMLHIDNAVSDGVYRRPAMLFAVSAHSKNPEAAATIVNCLLNEPEGVEALGSTRGLPVSKAGQAILSEKGLIDPILKEANDLVMAASGPAVSPFNENPEVRSNFIETLEEYGYGMLSAEEAAEQIIDGTNRVLNSFY